MSAEIQAKLAAKQADQELAEVHRQTSVHEVNEHQVAGVALLDADWKLVGEAPDRLLPS